MNTCASILCYRSFHLRLVFFRQKKGITLHRILILHDIMANLGNTPFNAIQMLCGLTSTANVVFVSTMWGKDLQEQDTLARQENKLRTRLKAKLDTGARVERWISLDSAVTLLQKLIGT